MKPQHKSAMKYLDLFSGIGGFTLGIQQVYEEISSIKNLSKTTDWEEKDKKVGDKERQFEQLSKYTPTGLSCIGFSEIDKYAIQIYQKHFPKHKNYGDITKINEKELPDFELLVGGFPCPSFSIAGRRAGFEDVRGQLVFEIIRILRGKKPKMFLLENVKGLLSHDKGKTMEIICEQLCESGYAIDFEVLNSKNFGVPQNRERVFIVGKRLDTLPDGAIY